MSGFGPSPVYPGALALDPTKHVNYVEGMVLGSADLRQEFAYHAQRPQWLVRDLVGYGTVWGLAVSQRTGARGPEVVVSSGVALDPRGQFIRVAPAQCAPLNDWLAGRTADILARKQTTANPNVSALTLYVVLGYRSCDSDPVPIAGEPCRTEQDSVAPSRTGDDFQLELAFDPPPQPEEDALREFFAWLQPHITVTGGGAASLTIAQFLDEIRAAARAAAAAVTSPPGAGPRLVDKSPPMHLSVPAALLPDYVRATLRLWATELRPLWRPDWLGDKHGWAGDEPFASADNGNQVVLAKLTLRIEPPGLNSTAWTVARDVDVSPPDAPIAIADDVRPYVLPLRFLQEWLITQSGAAGGGGGGGPSAGPQVVAAGVLNANATANARSAFNGLKVQSVTSTATATQLLLSFGGYSVPPTTGGPQYLVKVLPSQTAIPNLVITFDSFQAGGIQLLLTKTVPPATTPIALVTADLNALQLMVEVSRYP
ncbi:MAG TPA: hypothetical protein VF516_44480 [Kofleriaceae bacterium]